jgi:hypothetical protein
VIRSTLVAGDSGFAAAGTHLACKKRSLNASESWSPTAAPEPFRWATIIEENRTDKKRCAIFTGFAVAVLALTSCGSPTPIPDPLEYSTFAALQTDCKNVLEQDRPVMITGELILPYKVTCDRLYCGLNLHSLSQSEPTEPGFLDTATILVRYSTAPNANEMAQIGNEYVESDIKLYTEDGRILYVGDTVTVIGRPETYPCLTLTVQIIR